LLGNITSLLAKKLLDRLYGGDESKVPTLDYLGAKPIPLSETVVSQLGVSRSLSDNQIVYNVGSPLPDTSLWLETLAGPRLDWLRALLITPIVVQGSAYIDNPLKRLFAPRAGQRVVLDLENGLPVSISLFGSARSHGVHKPEFKAVEAKYNASAQSISVIVFEDRRDVSVPLYLQFEYKPSMPFAPIHEVAADRNKRIKEFYWRLWFGDDEVLPEVDVRATYTGPEVTINANDIDTFCNVVGNQSEPFKAARTTEVQAPMDFAIVTGWQVSPYCNISKCNILKSCFIGHHEGHFPCVNRR
jgi:fatty acid synthase subunit alpha, fungi type